MNADVMGTDTDPFYGAPVVLVVLADKNRPTHIYDGSLVMGNLMNAAASLGIGSCWIHRAKEVFASENGAWKVIMKASDTACSDIRPEMCRKRSLVKRIMCIM